MAKLNLRKLKDQATKAVEKKQYGKAAELYLEIAQAEPGDPDWHQRAGEAFRKVPDAAAGSARAGARRRRLRAGRLSAQGDRGVQGGAVDRRQAHGDAGDARRSVRQARGPSGGRRRRCGDAAEAGRPVAVLGAAALGHARGHETRRAAGRRGARRRLPPSTRRSMRCRWRRSSAPTARSSFPSPTSSPTPPPTSRAGRVPRSSSPSPPTRPTSPTFCPRPPPRPRHPRRCRRSRCSRRSAPTTCATSSSASPFATATPATSSCARAKPAARSSSSSPAACRS